MLRYCRAVLVEGQKIKEQIKILGPRQLLDKSAVL